MKRTSPFYGCDNGPLSVEPRGPSAEEYLEIWVTDASPQEWIALAADFLAEFDPDEA